ncbi:MAG: HAMP domain-containing sensor histidine kinase [Cellulosilyticaceae bacterium]
MSRFGGKLLAWILLVIVVLGGLSLSVNTQFVERYYLKIKKDQLNQVYETVVKVEDEKLQQLMTDYRNQESLWVSAVVWTDDLDRLNGQIISQLELEGIRIKKLWLWEGDVAKLQAGEVVNGLYNQGKLGYSVLVKCFKQGSQLMIVCSIVPHVSAIIEIINVFFIVVWGVSFLLMAILIMWFVRRFTKPLVQIKGVADEIAHLNFEKLELTTGDELQSVAHSINQMSDALRIFHEQLEAKHHAMKRLLSDVSHELKTPIALIKAYASGIEDGLDDGTFLQTIIGQNEVMAYRVDQLLHLSRLENQDMPLEAVCLSQMIKTVMDEQKLYLKEEGILLEVAVKENLWVMGNPEALHSVFANLLSNSIKYTKDQHIGILLEECGDAQIRFVIQNGVGQECVDTLAHWWEPFYVGETSRNKNLSGTGLGLYIVRSLLQKYGVVYGVHLKEQEVVFELMWHKMQKNNLI